MKILRRNASWIRSAGLGLIFSVGGAYLVACGFQQVIGKSYQPVVLNLMFGFLLMRGGASLLRAVRLMGGATATSGGRAPGGAANWEEERFRL